MTRSYVAMRTLVFVALLIGAALSSKTTHTFKLKHILHGVSKSHGESALLRVDVLDGIETQLYSIDAQKKSNEPHTQLYPDPNDLPTITTLAKMTFDTYYEPHEDEIKSLISNQLSAKDMPYYKGYLKRDPHWMPIDWNETVWFGWKGNGLRGYVVGNLLF